MDLSVVIAPKTVRMWVVWCCCRRRVRVITLLCRQILIDMITTMFFNEDPDAPDFIVDVSETQRPSTDTNPD